MSEPDEKVEVPRSQIEKWVLEIRELRRKLSRAGAP